MPNFVVIVRGYSEKDLVTRFYFNVEIGDALNRFKDKGCRHTSHDVIEFIDELYLTGAGSYLSVIAMDPDTGKVLKV